MVLARNYLDLISYEMIIYYKQARDASNFPQSDVRGTKIASVIKSTIDYATFLPSPTH
jgi:hypothetical protein